MSYHKPAMLVLTAIVVIALNVSHLPAEDGAPGANRDFGRGLSIKPTTGPCAGQEIQLYKASHALVVGNGAYQGNGWDPLPGAVQDARDVAAALKRNGFSVTIKTDLTKAQFDEAFGEFAFTHGKDVDARLLFYYAGHGYTRKMSNDQDLGFIVMTDAGNPDTDYAGFRNRSVDMDALVTRAKEINARHALFLFDSCFSGTILNFRDKADVPEVITDNVRYKARQFIAAGRDKEPVPDHSAFKRCFLDLLEGREKLPLNPGYITGEQLGVYLKSKVPYYFDKQHPQYGKIKDPALDKGDFVFSITPEASRSEAIQQGAAGFPREELSYTESAAELNMRMIWIDGNAQTGGSYWMSATEVTNAQYKAFLKNSGYDGLRDADKEYLKHIKSSSKYASSGDDYPVVHISWKNARTFCDWLTTKTRQSYCLPNEARWEYACRAGSAGDYGFGSDVSQLGEYAWSHENSGDKTHPVAQKKPNPWGLYDMHGNVWEWCEDVYEPGGVPRVARGGGWLNSAGSCTSSGRYRYGPALALNDGGFRVCRIGSPR